MGLVVGLHPTLIQCKIQACPGNAFGALPFRTRSHRKSVAKPRREDRFPEYLCSAFNYMTILHLCAWMQKLFLRQCKNVAECRALERSPELERGAAPEQWSCRFLPGAGAEPEHSSKALAEWSSVYQLQSILDYALDCHNGSDLLKRVLAGRLF
ncbi:hypothetical protein UY3_09840 [Chelonia mydas]|uniref:Uncharacterized protein n=1 Tax=Chelonia mydas TaxID=8469 RepID=M7BY43_CHEMY|nr:hypothetical protein UY3_09840 [Chelonia mydas]